MDKTVVRRFDAAIRELADNPRMGKPLRGQLSGKWSLRVGEYRLVYEFSEVKKTLTLLHAGHRKSVYK